MKRTGHPKREDGYTMIFNELLEALMCADIPKRARRLIDVQMRFSFGCGPKSFTALTTKDFAMLSSLDLSNARKAISWLVKNDIFEPDAGNHGRYRLNKFYHLWKVKVPLRDNPAYKEVLQKTIGRQVNLTYPEKVKTTHKSSGDLTGIGQNDLNQEVETTYPEKVKTTYKSSGDLTVIGQNDLKKEVETTYIDRSKRPKIFADSPSESETCDPRKKVLKKDKERKEDISSSYANQGSGDPVSDPAPSPVPDDNPFFAPLADDHAFWDTLAAAYPDQDILAQIRKMTAWLMANPKRKHKDYKRFIQGWLAREERKENANGSEYPDSRRRDRDDPEEEPPPFSDFPPELVIR